jgi:hypothetical protein
VPQQADVSLGQMNLSLIHRDTRRHLLLGISTLTFVDRGYDVDPVTGTKKRRQKWHTFKGTRKQAEGKLADLLKELKDGPTSIRPH